MTKLSQLFLYLVMLSPLDQQASHLKAKCKWKSISLTIWLIKTPDVFSSLLCSYALFDLSLRVRSGRSACEISSWISDTALRCKQSSGRMGFPPASNEKILGVTMGFRFGSLSATLTYDSVGISSLFPINYPMSGKLYISVIGSGISLNDNSFEGKLGHTGIQQTVWFSDTSILCKFLLAFATGSRSVFFDIGIDWYDDVCWNLWFAEHFTGSSI